MIKCRWQLSVSLAETTTTVQGSDTTMLNSKMKFETKKKVNNHSLVNVKKAVYYLDFETYHMLEGKSSFLGSNHDKTHQQ